MADARQNGRFRDSKSKGFFVPHLIYYVGRPISCIHMLDNLRRKSIRTCWVKKLENIICQNKNLVKKIVLAYRQFLWNLSPFICDSTIEHPSCLAWIVSLQNDSCKKKFHHSNLRKSVILLSNMFCAWSYSPYYVHSSHTVCVLLLARW